MMKNSMRFLCGLTALSAVFLLAGCSNTLDPQGVSRGTGYVKINLDSGENPASPAAARTLLPSTFSFGSCDLKFTKGAATVEKTGWDLDNPVELEEGTWKLELKAYLGTGDGKTLAASGVNSSINVTANATNPALVNITFVSLSGTGSLDYTIADSSGITLESAVISFAALSGTAPADINILGGFTGSQGNIPAGHYIVTVTLTGEGKKAVRQEVAHIYKNQISTMAFTFEADNFHTTITSVTLVGDMTGWSTGAAMTKDDDDTFIWAGDTAANMGFRFELPGGKWLVPENNDDPVSAVTPGETVWAAAHNNRAWKITAAGYHLIRLDPSGGKIYLSTPQAITLVTINGGNTSAAKGNTKNFIVTVDAKNGADDTVTWSLSTDAGTIDAGTSINPSTGLLTVASGQEDISLKVKAVSNFDNDKYDEVTVAVNNLPTVTGISVAAAGNVTEILRGGVTLDFTATVSVENGAPNTVVWSLSGKDKDGQAAALNAATSITENGTDNNKAALFVAADENAVDITVTATSNYAGFTTVSGGASVFVRRCQDLYIIGEDFGGWTLGNPAGTTGVQMTYGTRGVYGWTGVMYQDHTFKFHDATITGWNDGKWFNANGNDIAPAGTMQVIPDNASGLANSWKTAAEGRYTISLDTTAHTVNFTQHPYVAISVSPNPVSAAKGSTKQFTATVAASGGATNGYEWELGGAASSATTLSSAGLLSVGADETAATLTVKAKSTYTAGGFTPVEDTVTVTVTEPTGNAGITLTIVDKGGELDISGWPGTPVIHKSGGTGSISLNATNAAYTYAWYVDGGLAGAGAALMISAANYQLGGHSILLVGTKDGVPWSKIIGSFTVAAHP
ncbi:MAG: hypothetical protein LBK02_08370 [Treponema sp.]|jgi:hypothetical protein|nr:hypothetical protein [Treponema sp.]